jgi:hypothetical protein
MEVEKADHPALAEAQRESLQLIELARRVAAADDRADGAPGDHVDRDAGPLQDPQDADMRPAPRRAAAERQPIFTLCRPPFSAAGKTEFTPPSSPVKATLFRIPSQNMGTPTISWGKTAT